MSKILNTKNKYIIQIIINEINNNENYKCIIGKKIGDFFQHYDLKLLECILIILLSKIFIHPF